MYFPLYAESADNLYWFKSNFNAVILKGMSSTIKILLQLQVAAVFNEEINLIWLAESWFIFSETEFSLSVSVNPLIVLHVWVLFLKP